MVRETRHLWVGNLPDNIREDRIREHFKRYGRVQSVKLLPRSTKEETGEGTMACTVAFMDIKSASKAHNTEHKVDDRTLTTEYYEPAAIPSAASPQTTTSPYSTSPCSTRFPNGHSSSEEHGSFGDRFYDRTNSRVAEGEFIRRGGGYHDANRSRNRDRGFRNGPYNVIMDRGSHRTLNNSWSYDSGGGSGGCTVGTGGRYNSQNETGYTTNATNASAAASTNAIVEAGAGGGGGSSERRTGTLDQSTKKKTKSRSGSRSPSPSGSTSSRSPSRSRSRSSSSSSCSSTSRTSSTSSPKSRRTAANSHLAHSDDRRPLAICVKNLPLRSSDTSLKDGLYHEYKKHGKVTSVKVVGQNSERYAIVCFKKPEDVEKALEVSYDKLFFGCKIDVASYQGFDVEDNDLRPYEAEIDEFHPKATRTLFIGNLEKDITASDLRKHFDQFGEIIEIDIKNQGNVSLYAFCQYSDIVSVVKAIRKMDGEHLGNNRIKLGFGKSMPTNVVWVDGIVENVNEKYLRIHFDPFGPISKISIDRDRGQALIFYEQMVGAQTAVSKMRGYNLKGNKIQVDFASRECQQSFYEHLEKQGAIVDRGDERRDSTSRSFDSTRFSRYDTPTRPRTSSYSSRSSIAASQITSAIPSPGTPGSVTPRATNTKSRINRFEYYEGDVAAERHFRNYDEYSQGSAASQDDPYEPEYGYNNHDSPSHLEVLETRSMQNISTVEQGTIPYAPPDIRNLQKERVHLLEQLEECPSSGDEHISSKKRLKLDLLENAIGTDVIIEANRDHRKVMEVRRLSDVSMKHHSRRPSIDSKHSRDLIHDRSAYVPHAVCKRRKTAGSDAGSRVHHYDHSGSESVGGSRPGTPLCDERPENFPPTEPRRVPRERDGILSLPLPKFASQVMGRGSVSVAGIKGQKDTVLSSPPPAVTSPRISNPKPTSPVHVPPPASPPPRPPSLSSNSSDSDNPPSPSLDERIKSLDEKYEKWSGSRALSAAGGDALAKLDATREEFKLRHKLLDFDLKKVQPSEIVKSVMAKPSVFDEDLKRLENVGEKYEPKEFTPFPRTTVGIQSVTTTVPSTTTAAIKIAIPSTQAAPKTPAMHSPRSTGNNMIPAKGLQYPFPSHPPIQSAAPTLPPQTPPPSSTTSASSSPQLQTSTTTRSTSLGENRLKPCGSASSDNRISSKVNVNRSVIPNNLSAPLKTVEKNSGNIPSDTCATTTTSNNNNNNNNVNNNTNNEVKIARTLKHSDKITCRRDSSSSSPRGDIKSRRNSDVGPRRTDEPDKIGDNILENDQKSERAKSEERRRDQQHQHREKQRLENERLEMERLEKEQQEKERLEKERLEREKQEREKELEKERLQKEKAEQERIEREQREKREQERIKREREEQERLRREEDERLEKLRGEREQRERKEKEETERKEREKQAEEEKQAKKDRHEAEKLEREKRREEEKKHKDENHDRRKEESKHRENHSDIRHRENNINNEHKHAKQHSKEEKDKAIHEIFKRNDTHERNSSDKSKHLDKEIEIRRKESVKENRDNNMHEKLKDIESLHMSFDLDKPKSDPSRRKERNNSLPSNISSKRRLSSQECLEITNESKKSKIHSDHKKISDRRDSKDSIRSEDRNKCKVKNSSSKSLEEKLSQSDKPNFVRESDEKRKDKDRDDKHRSKQKFDKQKSKSKSREKESRESPIASTPKELSDKDFLAKLDLRSTEEVGKSKEQKKDTKEKRKDNNDDLDRREKDEKRSDDKTKKDRIGSSGGGGGDRSKQHNKVDDQARNSDEKNSSNKSQLPKKERIRKTTLNSSDNTDSDEPRKHSIFDIVDDEPAYISMYDKVKARSCKNMQKQEEEKRQEKIKAKFSQLKQSRAKREEKKRSTSWDEDSDSDRSSHHIKMESKNRRSKMILASSDEEYSLGKLHKKRDFYTDSDSDRHKHKNDGSDEELIRHRQVRKLSSRSINETSDEDYKQIKSELFSENEIDRSSDHDMKPFRVKDEFRRSIKKERKTSRQEDSYDKMDSESLDSKPPLSEIKSEKINNRHSFLDNSSADESEFKKEKTKKHKKKQKRMKHSVSSEDSSRFESVESSQNESSDKSKHHDKKRQHTKKDKKRDKSKDRDKSKRSKRSKSATKSDFKHDGKMENIFGSLSDSSENGINSSSIETKVNNSFFNDENVPSRFSDSDMEKVIRAEEAEAKEEHRKRKERKRKEKERRLQEAAAAAALAEAADHFNENSMDFADMGKQLEANIKDEPVDHIEEHIERNETNIETDNMFNYYDGMYQDYKKEDRKEIREKKKKRKKSKEEKQKHHHHHDKSKVRNETKKEILPSLPEPTTPVIHETKKNQSLPILDISSSSEEKIPSENSVSKESPKAPPTPNAAAIPTPSVSSKEKKREKFIPGFGLEIDETIHENAVKSISDFETTTTKSECPKVEEVKVEKVEETTEEKPRVVISQEETEDAVAALLGESFSNEFEYPENDISSSNDQSSNLVEESIVQDDEEMRQAVQSLGASDLEVKPETPQSEHELQIDTDTEEQDEISMRFEQQPKTPDMSELLHPPKTPDIPTYFKTEESKPAPSPLVIKSTACIGSPPSLAPITPQPSSLAAVKRNLEVPLEIPSKMPPLALPPLIEPAKTVISQGWSTKPEETVKAEPKVAVVAKVTSPQAVSCSASNITNTAIRTYPSVMKMSETSYPLLTAISKQDNTATPASKPEIPSPSLPLLQVTTAPALHNLPARSPVPQKIPSNLTQDVSNGQPKIPNVSKIRFPITSVIATKPLQATAISLPQSKVAFSSEPPKLVTTQDPRPRMISAPFPFSANQKMVVQTNIPMAGGLLVPARPGHFNYIPSQVAFSPNSVEKPEDSPKPSPSSVALASPTNVIQMKPQSIIIPPGSHIAPGTTCLINNQKIMKISENPPSLVAISTADSPSAVPTSSTNSQPKVTISPESSVQTTEKQDAQEIEEKPVESNSKSVETLEPNVDYSQDSKEEKPIEIKSKDELKPLAIEQVTEEMNLSLKKEPEDDKIKKDNTDNNEEIKSEIAQDPIITEKDESVIKETHTVKSEDEKSVTGNTISENTSDIPVVKEFSDHKEDKEDSDYWSPKDVNIDSVIKTLCSADELSNHSNDNGNNKENKSEKEAELEKSPEHQLESANDSKDLDDSNKSDTETMDDSAEETEDKETTSKAGIKRGGRGRGRKGRGGVERGGVQTRRGKVVTKDATTPSKRGGGARGGKNKTDRKTSKSESEAPTDIYEFRDDEENRPRLILTIKQSNTNPAAVQSAVKEVPKEAIVQQPQLPPAKPTVVETKEKAEEFVQPVSGTNTRKSRRLQEKDISRTTVDDTIEDVVKNTVVTRSNSQARRSGRQPTPVAKTVVETSRKSPRGRKSGRRSSETSEELNDEKERTKSGEDTPVNSSDENSKAETNKSDDSPPPPLTPTNNNKEENKAQVQVAPVIKEAVVEKPPIGLKAAVLRRIKGEMGQEPTSLIDPVTGLLTPMRECEENKYIPVPGDKKSCAPPTTVSATLSVASENKVVQPSVITSSQQPVVTQVVKTQTKPQSLKAHVLSSQAAQAVVTQQVPPVSKQNAVIVSTAQPTPTLTPILVNVENKAQIPFNQNLNVNVSVPNYVQAHISPRTTISSSPKPMTVKQPMASPSQMYNLMAQQAQHKQLLQINKSSPPATIPKGIVVSTTPIMKHPQAIAKQVAMAKGPMPLHLSPGVPAPNSNKSPNQSVGGGNRLIPGKIAMEPPKIDVSIPNLMSVRSLSSLSPQGTPRHLAQSGMPVPGYEATLHGDQGLYNRSRSPPPAHQNSPSPQAETMPHFPRGSVTLRPPHDLSPAHYMHVVYQHPYLRHPYHFSRSSIVPGGIEKPGDGQEGEEAPVTSPELRIQGSVGLPMSTRGAAVPHSLHSPHDRATESPQIGQVYNMQTARMQHYNPRYYESPAEPPPAHRPMTSHSSLAALGSDRPPLSHMAALGVPDRPLGSHLPPDRPLSSHLPPDRPLGSHLPPDRPLSGHSALAGHLPLGTPERPSSSHLPPDRPLSSHLTPDRLSGHSTPDRPISAHGLSLGAGLGAAGNLMGAVARHIGVDAPTTQRGLQAATPPHASQVPPQAESLFMLLKHYPRMWQGLLALKNDQAAVQMYFVSGNAEVAKCSLPKNLDGSTPPLRIFQRMRLEPPQVEGVARKMQMEKEHCMLLALPCGHDHMDVLKQSTNLTNGFITYLQQKQAAGIVNVAAPGTTQPPAYVVHIFPSCNFVNENLRRIAPSLLERVADIAHLLIVITTV